MSMNPLRRSRFTLLPLGLSALFALGSLGCPGPDSRRTRRYKKSMLQESLQRFETTGLLIGTFPLATNAVIDGDTIRVSGLKTTLRLLAIDTEETFKKDKERRLYEQGWDFYLKTMTDDGRKLAKMATPLGDEAKKFAEAFFSGVQAVRLERDHPREIRGRFDRYLTYVFAKKDGRWVNYNLECVRAGMSPYFTKYAYSRRFHSEFVAAQEEARKNERGIWDPKKQHYTDYDRRLVWWNARADFIQEFEKEAAGKPNYVVLTNWDALRRLQDHVDKEVVLLGSVASIQLGDRGPTRVMLARRRGADFPLIFFDKDVFGSSGIARHSGEYVRVTGRVAQWFNKFRKRYELQIVVNLPGQIRGSDKVPASGRWNPEKPQGEKDY